MQSDVVVMMTRGNLEYDESMTSKKYLENIYDNQQWGVEDNQKINQGSLLQ